LVDSCDLFDWQISAVLFFAFEQWALPRCSFAVGVALSPFQVAYNILSFQDDEEDEGAPSNDIDRLL